MRVSFEKFRTLPSSLLEDDCDGDDESDEESEQGEEEKEREGAGLYTGFFPRGGELVVCQK